MLMVHQRKEYLDKLIAFKDKQLIKVVTGIRRCGKSTLLEIYQNWLLEQGTEEEQIISINFEDIDFDFPSISMFTIRRQNKLTVCRYTIKPTDKISISRLILLDDRHK